MIQLAMNDSEPERTEVLFREMNALEKQFHSLLERQTPYAVDVTTLVQRTRQQVEDLLICDIEYALSKTIEDRLWTRVHYRVIEDFRKRIANHDKQYGASKPVEKRKLIDLYTIFLKDTTNFYRTHIQKLVAHFNITELHPIVQQFKLQVDIPADGPKFQSKKIKSLVFTEVQICLIKLGDISRYRALTPSRNKSPPKPDYGPAYGYYVLAQTLLPENGAPANQLAVLSTYSKDFLASTYYFYRALACDEPFPTAGNNLALGFRKVLRDGVDARGVEREDVGALMETFLRMHAQFHNQQESFDDSGFLKMLGDAVADRAVTSKMLERFTFINLSALYVATKREQPNIDPFLQSILSQYTLLLQFLYMELQQTPPTTDISAYITPIIRRTASSLRLYSKWLVLHLHLITAEFWQQYATTATVLLSLWPTQNQPKLSYPLEEDLVAAGFAPLDVPAYVADSRKRKHKRDRAKIGNRKKGFDKLLLQWGRSGGDSVTSTRERGTEHPNVEMTLRLADLLSDALEIASIPASGIELVGAEFKVCEVETVAGEEQLISTGLPVEALGRMSLEEIDADERPFSEPQESSEEELGMAFSPGKMVDDIVGDEQPSEQPDVEEIMFSGRATRKQLRSNGPGHQHIPSPISLPATHLHTSSPAPSPVTPVAQGQPSQPKTAADLVSRVLAFSNRSSSPVSSPKSLSPFLPSISTSTSALEDRNDPYTSFHSSPRLALHPFEDVRKREESPVGVIGQGRASPRRTEGHRTPTGNGSDSPRWSGGFSGL